MREYASYFVRRKRRLLIVLNACLLAFVSIWLYRNISFSDLALEMGRIPPGAVLLAMTTNVVVLSFYALRLSAIVGAGFMSCFVITTIGFTFNSVVPLRVGEGVKVYAGKSWFGIAIGTLVAAVVMEKLYDAAALALLSVSVGLQANQPIIDARTLSVLVVIIPVSLGALVLARHALRRIVGAVGEWRMTKSARLDALVKSAETVVLSHDAARAAFFTLSIWLTHACLVFFAFSALLPEIDFSFPGAMTLLLIAALAIAVPASPAGLGVFEAGVVAFLINAHGVPKERALSAALAYHFSITAPHTVFAALFLVIGLSRLFGSKSP